MTRIDILSTRKIAPVRGIIQIIEVLDLNDHLKRS